MHADLMYYGNWYHSHSDISRIDIFIHSLRLDKYSKYIFHFIFIILSEFKLFELFHIMFMYYGKKGYEYEWKRSIMVWLWFVHYVDLLYFEYVEKYCRNAQLPNCNARDAHRRTSLCRACSRGMLLSGCLVMTISYLSRFWTSITRLY